MIRSLAIKSIIASVLTTGIAAAAHLIAKKANEEGKDYPDDGYDAIDTFALALIWLIEYPVRTHVAPRLSRLRKKLDTWVQMINADIALGRFLAESEVEIEA